MVGKNVFLRALEPEDLPVMYTWENDRDNWMVSNTTAPFSNVILPVMMLFVSWSMSLPPAWTMTSFAMTSLDRRESEPPS